MPLFSIVALTVVSMLSVSTVEAIAFIPPWHGPYTDSLDKRATTPTSTLQTITSTASAATVDKRANEFYHPSHFVTASISAAPQLATRVNEAFLPHHTLHPAPLSAEHGKRGDEVIPPYHTLHTAPYKNEKRADELHVPSHTMVTSITAAPEIEKGGEKFIPPYHTLHSASLLLKRKKQAEQLYLPHRPFTPSITTSHTPIDTTLADIEGALLK